MTKDTLTGPPPGTGYQTLATFDGVGNVALNPIDPPPPGGTAQLVGFLDVLQTTDPALACLSTGPKVAVWSFSTMPGVYVATAATPTDCATADWSLPVMQPPAGAASPAAVSTTTTSPPTSPTTTPTAPTTTTSRPPSTTTTTSTSTTTTTTTPP